MRESKLEYYPGCFLILPSNFFGEYYLKGNTGIRCEMSEKGWCLYRMTEKKDNVVLLPKTVDYYQIQLTRLLETEQYAQALKVLQFLIQCQCEDKRLYDEWNALSDWLMTMEYGQTAEIIEEEEESETELVKKHLNTKIADNVQYVENLLHMLLHQPSLEKQILALEQLAYIDHAKIDETLHRWLADTELHPTVQFRALQILKRRGINKTIQIPKLGQQIEISIQDTPLTIEQFPPVFASMLYRIQQVSEVNNPALFYFAEQTWHEWLAYIYGTQTYHLLLEEETSQADVWAAALHLLLVESMFNFADERETKTLYGITDEQSFVWNRAVEFMRAFAKSSFLPKS